MPQFEKLIRRILSGQADATINFADFLAVLRYLEFDERVRGSHHIFARSGIPEIVNIQPGSGGKAKPYQVRQLRSLLLRYQLWRDLDAEV